MQSNLINLLKDVVKNNVSLLLLQSKEQNQQESITTDVEITDENNDNLSAPSTPPTSTTTKTTTAPTLSSSPQILEKPIIEQKINAIFPTFDSTKPNETNQVEIRSSFEINFRIFFNDLIKLESTTTEEIDISLQLSFYCTELNYLDSIVPFQLFEDLFDSKSISKCLTLFSLLESRADLISQDSSFSDKGRKKNLLLKICIELLKRFSRSSNPDSCGRILIFLAYVFPLSDPSGLNTKGEHNIHPEETLDLTDMMQYDQETSNGETTTTTETTTIDQNFYKQFWGLQKVFQNPQAVLFTTTTTSTTPTATTTLTLNKVKWDTFIESLEVVINTFSTHINLDELTTLPKKHYFTKYLTSSNLMKLQLKDSIFRRNILTQVLISFQNIEILLQKYPTTLSDAQKHCINDLTIKIYKILSQTQPNGAYFSNCLLSILKREKNWILWKRDHACKSFEKTSCEPIVVKKRKLKKPAKNRVNMGNAVLSRLWNLSSTMSNNNEYLKTQNKVALDTLLDPLKTEMVQEREAAQKEKEKLERRAIKEKARSEAKKKRREQYEIDKAENPSLEFDEDLEMQDIDSDDLDDLDDPKPLLRNDSVYKWKTIRLISRENFSLFKHKHFDELVESSCFPPVAVTPPSIEDNNNNTNNPQEIESTTATTEKESLSSTSPTTPTTAMVE
ncbi:hypothetical protein CYY_004866 [Polysphondylium violaceum]|uniref:THO complex subunit 1 n=1 Tax=Polysphondylium violaceum TaxID=133409 RepID=A0A8J4PXF8_9MYCE|nr:hypothetical protein CYY_004866 [Polysphondylium violaceum]